MLVVLCRCLVRSQIEPLERVPSFTFIHWGRVYRIIRIDWGSTMASTSDAAAEELEALVSIFDTDFELLPHPTWGYIAFRITIVPVTGGTDQDNKVSAAIRFNLSKKYPAEWYVRCVTLRSSPLSIALFVVSTVMVAILPDAGQTSHACSHDSVGTMLLKK